MIAIARPSVVRPAIADSYHDRFLALLPAIRDRAHFAFRHSLRDIREELIADVVANAYRAFVRLMQESRETLIYATPLADFAIRQVRAGRRVGQPLNSQDVMAPGIGRAVARLDHFDAERG